MVEKLAQWELVKVAKVQKAEVSHAAVGKSTVYYTVVQRVTLTAAQLHEFVDVVMTPMGDCGATGEWEVSMGDELFIDRLTCPGQDAPTAEDLEELLLRRTDHVLWDSRWLGRYQRRWVHRRFSGHEEDDVLITTVHNGRLYEELVNRHAVAVTWDGARGVTPTGDSPEVTGDWRAPVLVCDRLRRDGSWAPLAHEEEVPMLRAAAQADDGPWVPRQAMLASIGGLVTWDGHEVGGGRMALSLRSFPAKDQPVVALVTGLGLTAKDGTHARKVYDRLPRVNELFDVDVKPEPLGRRPRRVFTLTAIQHGDGVVHLRTCQDGLVRALFLLHRALVETEVRLDDSEDNYGMALELRLCDAELDLERALRVLKGDVLFDLQAYRTVYDTHTPGPTVRFHRSYRDRVHSGIHRWVHLVDYGTGGVWMMGRPPQLREALAVVELLKLGVHVEHPEGMELQSLWFRTDKDATAVVRELRWRGVSHRCDTFTAGSED